MLDAFVLGAALALRPPPLAAQPALPSVPRADQAAADPLDTAGLTIWPDGRPRAWVAPEASVAALPAAIAPQREKRPDLARPFAAISATAANLRDSLVALARAQIGRRYRLGGATPEHGFDCSGLVRYVMALFRVALPRTATEQAHSGAIVARDTAQLRPGDLVTFGSTRRISHIGIYVGGGRFVQASSRAGRVIETPLGRALIHGAKPWRGARRVVPEDATAIDDRQSLSPLDDQG